MNSFPQLDYKNAWEVVAQFIGLGIAIGAVGFDIFDSEGFGFASERLLCRMFALTYHHARTINPQATAAAFKEWSGKSDTLYHKHRGTAELNAALKDYDVRL